MAILQWKRADFIVGKLRLADDVGKDIIACRADIKQATESEFGWCHDCLLLAVFGLYKNGFIENTNRVKARRFDFNGFNGHESVSIRLAFGAVELLMNDRNLTATALKRRLGGEQSIYSFIVHYFNNGLIRSA